MLDNLFVFRVAFVFSFFCESLYVKYNKFMIDFNFATQVGISSWKGFCRRCCRCRLHGEQQLTS